MARHCISLTKQNEEWLKSELESLGYSNKSELVNDLIRQARKQQAQVDRVRIKLEKAESSGFTNDNKAQILAQSKSLLKG